MLQQEDLNEDTTFALIFSPRITVRFFPQAPVVWHNKD
jgi:hypothetical protein